MTYLSIYRRFDPANRAPHLHPSFRYRLIKTIRVFFSFEFAHFDDINLEESRTKDGISVDSTAVTNAIIP